MKLRFSIILLQMWMFQAFTMLTNIPVYGKILTPLKQFKASDTEISSLAISPDNSFIVVGTLNSSGNKKFSGVTMWPENEWDSMNLDENSFQKHRLNLPIPTHYITQSLAISPNQKMIIGQSEDYIWKWDIENKSLIPFGPSPFLPVDIPPIINASFLLPNKNKIILHQSIGSLGLFGNTFTNAKIFNLNSGILLAELKESQGPGGRWAINPKGTLLATILTNNSSFIWDLKHFKRSTEWDTLKGKIQFAVLNLSENFIVSVDLHGKITLMDLTYKDLKEWQIDRRMGEIQTFPIVQIKISPNEKYIIYLNFLSYTLGIIEIKSGKVFLFPTGNSNSATEWPSKFIISDDSKYLIMGTRNGMVKVFEIKKILRTELNQTPTLDLNQRKDALITLTSTLTFLSLK